MEPFPDVLYAIVMGGIPPLFSGRTKQALARTKTFSDQQGAECVILTTNHSARFAHVVRSIRARGLVGEHVRIVNLFDVLSGVTTDSGDAFPDPGKVTRYPTKVKGLRAVRDPEQPTVYRYYDADDNFVLYRKYDDGTWFLLDEPDERLFIQDHFADGVRTHRESYDEYGTRRFVTHFDPETDKASREVYYRADGTAYLEWWLTRADGSDTPTPSRANVLDPDGKVVYEASSHLDLIHHYFDLVLAGRRVIMSTESRDSDPHTLTYRRDNVKNIFVLHNPHTRVPFNNVRAFSGKYRAVITQRDNVDAVVFITNAQRADAEAAVGRRNNFVVMPHPMRPVELDPTITPDPHLVVMLGRLDQQKQLDHAVRAFSTVVTKVPDARLEIYGLGADEQMLIDLIEELGLGENVKLMGFTSNPAAVYQHAAVALLTSLYEGQSLVVLEAPANRCPIISYDIPYGSAEVIKDGENGFLLPAHDIDALAAAIIRVLTDEELQRTMRERMATTPPELTVDAWMARWSALFNRLDAEGWPATAAPSPRHPVN